MKQSLPPPKLPIENIYSQIQQALLDGCSLVLQAPPGAGKSTGVPLCLLDAPWRAGKIVVLEPRRLAARMVAERLAHNLGEKLGERVGLTTRTDKIGGDNVVIEVMTEGILTRRLQKDPALSGVSAVIFDEFHERNVHTDIGLAFALECQQGLRDDLRLIVMSATLDADPVAQLMGSAPVLTSEGRAFPVAIRHLPIPMNGGYHALDMAKGMCGALKTIVAETAGTDYEGDILAFLPGQGEIMRVIDGLENTLPDGVYTVPLYGQLSPEQQRQAIQPSPDGQRKIVLATAVAETSVTLDGVSVVVDCGWQRTARFDAVSGVGTLVTGRVNLSSANQRTGRAGRLQNGVCYRLWAEPETRSLQSNITPEILVSDMMPFALDLALWGVTSPDALPLLDKPSPKSFADSQAILQTLGLLDNKNTITDLGRAVAKMPVHPRLGVMVQHCDAMGQGALGAVVAGLLSDVDILRFAPDDFDGDFTLRLDAYHGGHVMGARINKSVLSRVRKTAKDLKRHIKTDGCDTDLAGVAIAYGYPERMASSRRKGGDPKGGDSFICAGGKGAKLRHKIGALANSDTIAIAHMGAGLGSGGGAGDNQIYLASPIDKSDIEQYFTDQITDCATVAWHASENRVIAQQTRGIGAMVLSQTPLDKVDPSDIATGLADGVRTLGLHVLPWDKKTKGLRERLQFAHTHMNSSPHDYDYPNMSDDALLEGLETWFVPFVSPSMTTLKSLQDFDLYHALLSLVPYDSQKGLDDSLPTHMTMPTGSAIPIDYSGDNAPVVAVRIQEVFGMVETPTIGGKTVTMELLSPAHRPIQVTSDLAGFWAGSYAHVKAEMKGRYPKHYWPDNPADAKPTNRVKNKM